VASVQVLICEDSRSYAAALRRALEHDGEIRVAAVCGSAEEAIAALPRVQPDLVTMDIELPGMDGLQAVEEIMASRPLPILVVSAYAGAGTGKTAAALAAGALEAVAKDDLDLRRPAGAAAAAFRRRVTVLSRAHVIRHPRGQLRVRRPAAAQPRAASVIGMCASTGGPHVLAHVLRALPGGYAIPVLVVQHIAAGFTDGLARWLDETLPLPVRVAAGGEPARAGIWVAPEGAHLKIAPGGRLALDRRTVTGGHRPSGDVLLESIAAVAGPAGVAVVLSGMGRDGAAGALAVRQRGGLAMAQDQASSAVFGMPKAAADSGVSLVLSPAQIAAQLLGLRHLPFGEAR
jgi:two-component system, chemotaxis family, protein-glutamate methylesterase/glutaminase